MDEQRQLLGNIIGDIHGTKLPDHMLLPDDYI